MKTPRIVRVWGKADTFDIEFTHIKGGVWSCQIPPDTKDGQYATEIHAINEYGETAYWTGILYMCGGVCHLEIIAQPYTFWFSVSSIDLSFAYCHPLVFKAVEGCLRLEEQNYEITIEKGCCHFV